MCIFVVVSIKIGPYTDNFKENVKIMEFLKYLLSAKSVLNKNAFICKIVITHL